MKSLVRMLAVCFFCIPVIYATAQEEQEQLNLPGDNLNLYAVMKLFQESPTLEQFEKNLNDETNKVNNLDLNGDNQIDYIKVIDNPDAALHNIALRVAVSKDEDQDVAVFVINKDRNGQVHIQLIGDEDLYGKDYIIEPDSGAPSSTPNPGYAGDQPPPVPVNGYEVSAWPVVQFIYVPTYSVWRSPWHWGYYPAYWRPWTPFFWHEYYGYHYHLDYYYRSHYRYTPVYRIPAWHDRYYGGGLRARSTFVEIRARQDSYRQTYTRPDLANRGADLFRRDHPGAPAVNRPLPVFDRNNNNRPIVSRQERPANRPGNMQPGNGNADNSNGRPLTRPVNPNPVDGNHNANRPFTRPVNPNTDNGNTFPNRPVNPKPGNGNTFPNRPVTRPVNPEPANGNRFPDRRPITPNPANGNRFPDRPVSNPGGTNPGNGNNRPARPVTLPGNPNGNFPNRPVTRPSNTQPAPTPANGNNFPNRPVTRPPAPRPQEVRQPVQRPPEKAERPARHGRDDG